MTPYEPITGGKGLSWEQFSRITQEISEQPEWRRGADKAADYYDGNQLDAETLAELDEKGMAPLITNLIKPTVDVVLGMEAKTRSDWRVIADADEYQDVAEALSARLHEVERETRADRACSDAYAGQIKSGLGWVEVSRESDPFRYPYRCKFVHRRELFWDWLAQEPDLSDARYVVRKRWFDLDVVQLHFPKHKEALSAAMGRWEGNWLMAASENTDLANAFDQQRSSGIADLEWQNPSRGRICLMECWYRTHVKGRILRLPDERAVEYDPQNPMHQAVIESGMLVPESAIYARMNLSIWAGPLKLYDGRSDRPRMPYVPFWGYREDLTGVPYGLIRSMVSPQDEFNARRRKLMNILSGKRVIADSDALDTRVNAFSDVLAEVARPDSVIVLNPQRRNANAFEVQTDLGLGKEQELVMAQAQQLIQDVAGVYQAQLGKDSNATSGIAIQSLVEQGTTTLAEINDNYRYARRQTGEMIVNLIREDLTGRPVTIVVGEGRKKRPIQLNVPAQDPVSGLPVLANDVAKSAVKVALEDTPSTPAYRAQQLQLLTQVIQAMPPQAQALMAPTFVEMSELPNRQTMADQMRKLLGIPGDEAEADPEKEQLKQQLQQAMAMIEQLQQAPQMLTAQARQQEVALKEQELQLKASQMAAANEKTAVEIDKLVAETDRIESDTALNEERGRVDMAGTEINNRRAALEAELEAI